MNVRWIFSQEYFLPHNKVINNVGYFCCPSTQIQKDDIAEMPVHVLALSNDPFKRNFGLLVIELLFERECRKATCLALHLQKNLSQQLEFNVRTVCREGRQNEPGAILFKYLTFLILDCTTNFGDLRHLFKMR